MLFTIQIGEKLDLTKFSKQANYYIASLDEVTYHLYLPDYKIVAEIKAGVLGNSEHLLTLYIAELLRDQDGEIKAHTTIRPLEDNRFKESKIVQDIFDDLHSYKGYVQSSSVAQTVEQICSVIKLVHKINHLKIFL